MMMNDNLTPTPVELLQTLIRFDTTNPPGNEVESIQYLDRLLQNADIQTTILARDDRRPNLLARLPGRGDAPPLLLYGHVDVVTTAGQDWHHPPFAADIADGFIWGRGALDMKGGIAIMVAALLQAKAAGLTLPGDVILAVMSDEEANGDYGAGFLVEHHAEQFAGVRYAIGEGGGFSIRIAGHKFYPIMVAEKQFCSLQAVVRGPAGHGSRPIRGGAMGQLAEVLRQLEKRRLPVHVTAVTRQMLETVSRSLPFPQSIVMRQLLNPRLTGRLLDMLGEQGQLINPLLHNTVSPTIVHGGEKVNVIPGQITLDLDGRLLPGYTPDHLLHELGQLLGEQVTLKVTRYDPGATSKPDMTHYGLLANILQKTDPTGTPIPLLMSGVTDGRYFSRLGIQTYGFLPMDLPNGLIDTIHAANERIPIGALDFGINAVYQAITAMTA